MDTKTFRSKVIVDKKEIDGVERNVLRPYDSDVYVVLPINHDHGTKRVKKIVDMYVGVLYQRVLRQEYKDNITYSTNMVT